MKTRRHIGNRHIHLESTDSTNNRAIELASDVAYAGTVITAEVQSQGRGQHGRVWQSQPGTNVLLSVLLFPPIELRRPPVLTAFAAVAVAETVSEISGRFANIKWPNDVLVDGCKISGILIESGVRAPGPQYFVAGIGLNVNQREEDFLQSGLTQATSLGVLTGRRFDVAEIADTLVSRLDATYQLLLEGNLKQVETDWANRLGKMGQQVTVELMDSNEVQGELLQVSFDVLELQMPDGEVRHLRPEEIRHLR